MRKYVTFLLMLLFIIFMVSCNNNEEPKPKPEPDIETYMVTFMAEDRIYHQEKVKKGALLTVPNNPTPSSDEYLFKEWQLNGVKYDFSETIESDLVLNAIFMDNPKVVQLFNDLSFSNGFGLKGVSTTMGSEVFRHLTADNPDGDYYWHMAQWWTKYDMQYAEYEVINGVHIYKNESHEIRIDNKNNSLYMKLLASKEYDKPRENGQNWPHILIEQHSKQVKIAGAKKVIASMDFKIIRCDNMMSPSEYDPSRHAAQYLWYMTLRNLVPEGSDPNEVGKNNDYFWFGIPIYDNRSPLGSEEYKMVDQGFVGATNKLIYSMSNKVYLKNLPLEFGKTYHIEVDILPYLKDAYIYGIQNGALVNSNWENMYLGYMNFGWELPGTFDVESEVSNISTKVYY